MSKTITRFRKKKVYFTQVSNHALDDEAMSTQAFYIYSQVQRYITLETFTLNKIFLIKKCRMSEKTFEKYFKELRNLGYLKSYQYPGTEGNNAVTIEYDLLDAPDTTTAYHTVYNSKDEVVQEFFCKKVFKKVSKKVSKKNISEASNVDVEPVSEESCTPPKMRGVQSEGSTKLGELNNTDINNTNLNNTYSSIYQKKYCTVAPKEIWERQIGLIEENIPGYSRLNYKSMLNASRGDEQLVIDVYNNVIEYLYQNETEVKNLVGYLIKSIEKEL